MIISLLLDTARYHESRDYFHICKRQIKLCQWLIIQNSDIRISTVHSPKTPVWQNNNICYVIYEFIVNRMTTTKDWYNYYHTCKLMVLQALLAEGYQILSKTVTVHLLLSTFCHSPLTTYSPPSGVYHSSSTIHRLPSTPCRPPSTVHCLPSTQSLQVR